MKDPLRDKKTFERFTEAVCDIVCSEKIGLWPSDVCERVKCEDWGAPSKHYVRKALDKLEYENRVHRIGSFWYGGSLSDSEHPTPEVLLHEAWAFIKENHHPDCWPPKMKLMFMETVFGEGEPQ
jgi:hypothetical protein